MNLAFPADYRLKTKKEKRERKKAIEHGGDGDTNCNWCTWNGTLRLGTGAERFKNWKMNRDNPSFSIVEVNQNIESSPEDPLRLAVNQTPEKDDFVKLV